MRRALLLLVVLAGLVAACEDKYKDPDPKVMGYDYYPLEVGDWRIYDIMDIRYMSDVGDTTRFQLRERVDTTFYDQTNTLNYKIIRSVRANENTPWVDDSVMTVIKSTTSLMLTQHNIKHVKLVFPINNGKNWLGDAFNQNNIGRSFDPDSMKRSEYYNSKDTYSYTNVGDPLTLNGKKYENTLTVIQGLPIETWIGLDDRKEIYAKNVGMVYKQHIRIVYCNESKSESCPYGDRYKLYGHERHEKLISHGKE
ncbi:hypothetical protein [Pontibacter flavimaris]|uniref:Uncharacterized protein n=1 Tax=Pontibacter flavimaris TaxID=1797110 RepID=A0A1Q5PGP2_9BACT|nr:hypothetical protein [Pontibacter flavimaris]OKL41396.1 hypothetical protein A3841_10065 [Pontibacter flavimaris]